MQVIDNKKYHQLIISFLVFCSLFITLRLYVMGSAGSETPIQFLFSALPELFALVLFSIFFLRRKKEIAFSNLDSLDKVFLSFIAINLLVGSVVSADLKMIVYGARLTYFPMFFYFLFRYEDKIAIEKLVDDIFILISFVGLAGLGIYFHAYDWMITMILKTGGEVGEYFITRMTSIFWTPVVFSTCMSAAFVYFLWKYFTRNDKMALIHMGVVWLCLLFSVSRGSLVVVLLGFILISVFCFQWQRFVVAFSLMIVFFMTVAFYIGSPIEYITWLISSTADTVSLKEGVTRVDLWIHAFQNFSEHPFGYGLGKAGHVAVRFYAENSSEADVFSTDGWFLKLANETGVLGLLSYFSLGIYFFIRFLKARFHKDETLILLFTFFFIFNVQNLVSNVFDFYFFAPVYWMMIGYSVNLMTKKDLHAS